MEITRPKQLVDAGVEVVSGFSSSATNGARFRCSIRNIEDGVWLDIFSFSLFFCRISNPYVAR